ncbi:MAG: translesion error-prone DNA polymerase V autoproteolytic subunit [Bacteroidaceae bacterium]|nr:translesion error-prone DNA polymerase V autoproteolytic subunit [Bacteroidaceae bacterium]
MDQTKLKLAQVEYGTSMEMPYAEGIKAGFPSPAQDYLTDSIDLNKEIVKHKETTFYARVDGDSMQGAGICNGDIVVIDKSLDARNGDYIAAFIDGEFTLKQYKTDATARCAWLMPANPAFAPIKVTEENNFIIWGVVTHTIKKLR